MLRKMLLLAAFSLAMVSAASAQSAQQTMRDFGMLGKWARDCNAPPSRTNFHTVFAAMSSGNVQRTYYDGPDHIYNQYTITRAIRLPANQMSYQQVGPVGRMDVILLKDGNTYRIWSSVGADGKIYVKEGKFNDGAASPAETKCSK